MRHRLPRILLLLLLMTASVGGHRVYKRNYSQQIEMVPLVLDESDRERTKVGALTFLNAWELRSDNSNFGGISALVVTNEKRFLAVTDAGTLIGFTLGRMSPTSIFTPLAKTSTIETVTAKAWPMILHLVASGSVTKPDTLFAASPLQ